MFWQSLQKISLNLGTQFGLRESLLESSDSRSRRSRNPANGSSDVREELTVRRLQNSYYNQYILHLTIWLLDVD